MNPILAFFVKMSVVIPAMIIIGLISSHGFHQSPWISAILGGLIVYWITSALLTHRYLKSQGLSRKEYRFIKGNLKEARSKVFRLHKALLSIRHIPSLKERIEFMRVSKKIYSLTKKEPKRFYMAEQFYYSHLDSALEIAEKYVFLSRQPKKTRELDQALTDALWTLEEVKKSVEDDLYKVISNDIEKLDYEIDVAKHALRNHEH